MPLVAELAPVTFDELSARLGDAKVRAALPRWIASAEWRGLIVRNAGTPRAYSLGPAVSWLETAA